MASAFGHAILSVAVGKCFPKSLFSAKLWILGIVCSILPDADVIGFKFGIKYEDFWGHRGFTHSLVFAAILAVVLTFIFYRKKCWSAKGLGIMVFLFLSTASHAFLDAMTSGGLGVAFFSPFNDTRYFFPFRPIQVSPIGLDNFFSEWGLRVIKSEMLWIGLPSLLLIGLKRFFLK